MSDHEGEPMPPPMTTDAHILMRVLARHGVSQSALARRSNFSDASISRALSGAISMPTHVMRCALMMTGDGELRAYLMCSEPATETIDESKLKTAALFLDFQRALQTYSDIAGKIASSGHGANGSTEAALKATSALLGTTAALTGHLTGVRINVQA